MELNLPPGIEKVGPTVRIGPEVRFDDRALLALRRHLIVDGPAVVVRVEVGSRAEPPSPALRRAIAEDLCDPERVRAIAFVHRGRGVRAGLVRSVLRAVAKAQREVPAQVFEDLDEAQAWLDENWSA